MNEPFDLCQWFFHHRRGRAFPDRPCTVSTRLLQPQNSEPNAVKQFFFPVPYRAHWDPKRKALALEISRMWYDEIPTSVNNLTTLSGLHHGTVKAFMEEIGVGFGDGVIRTVNGRSATFRFLVDTTPEKQWEKHKTAKQARSKREARPLVHKG
ncbi:MAG: hypothetical protein QNK37_03375 [Acidobacteriota bacterium]|nr:hypothetical protein [Acidobacteriota bacterium]